MYQLSESDPDHYDTDKIQFHLVMFIVNYFISNKCDFV